MKCCENCFKSSVLKTEIRSLGKIGTCNFCSSTDVHVYDLETDCGLEEKFNELMNIFKVGSELIREGYPSHELFSIKNEFSHRWNIFNNLSENQIHLLLEKILSSKYPEKIDLLNNQVGIIEFINEDFLKNNSVLRGRKWDDFIAHIKHQNRFHSNYVNYEVLKSFLFRLTVFINQDEYFRARISNHEILNIETIGAPPPDVATAGRANSEGISHLYLGSDQNTVISEIRPSVGDAVYIGKYPIREELKIVDFRELNNIDVFDLEEGNIAQFAVNLTILNDINNAISKSIRSGDSKLDYIPTQFIVDYIKSINESDGVGFDGIVFKSTVSGGHNLMLFKPQKIECTRIDRKIIDSLSYGHS